MQKTQIREVVIYPLIRHGLTGFGILLASKYGVDGETVDALVGSLMTIIGLGWSILEKPKRTK